MKITFDYTQATYPAVDPTHAQGQAVPQVAAMSEAQLNRTFQFNLGDIVFRVEPGPAGKQYDVPSRLLSDGAVISSGVVCLGTGDGPHQDYKFLRQSAQYTYHLRTVLPGTGTGAVAGVIEKEMSVGAKPGDIGKLILYKGAATVADVGAGNWTARLVRPFIITAADLTSRDTGWGQTPTATAPTVDTTRKQVVDNAGDGYLHI